MLNCAFFSIASCLVCVFYIFFFKFDFLCFKGSNATVEGRKTLFENLSEDAENLSFEDLKQAAKEGRYNLTDTEIEDAIKKIAGQGATSISYAAFEKYLKRRIEANRK